RGGVHVERRALSECAPIPSSATDAPGGVLVTNPPFGERVGTTAALADLYGELGDGLRRKFTGWTGHVLAGNLALAKRIGLRAARRYPLYNGAIECRLLAFPISSRPVRSEQAPRWRTTVG